MAGVERQGLGVHPLGGAPLLIGRDGAVVGGDHEPAGLQSPGRRADRRAEDGALRCALCREDELPVFRGQVLREVLEDAPLREEQVAVCDLRDLTERRRRREPSGEAAAGLALGAVGRREIPGCDRRGRFVENVRNTKS